MKQLFRLLKILLFSRFRQPMGFFDEGEVTFRVWPNDLDPLLHMNNGVYLTLLDLGRIDLTIRTGMAKIWKEQGVYAVVASEAIRFKKSLGPFSKFSIFTKCVYWDDKYFFIEQRFEQKGKVAAKALIKGRILNKKGEKIAPGDVIKLMGVEESPPPSEAVQHFLRTDHHLY
jgi:acyl-CoA thioesterase FadM